MERTSAHQVLPPSDQKQIEKNILLNILTNYAISDSVELLYQIIHAARKHDKDYDIDMLIQRIRDEYDLEEHQKDEIQAEWKENKTEHVNSWLGGGSIDLDERSSQYRD